MDWGELAAAAVTGVLSGLGAAVVYSFIVGRKYQKLIDDVTALKKADETHKEADEKFEKSTNERLDKVETDVDTMTRENSESWSTINRSLGYIEGLLSPQQLQRPQTPPPFPPPRKSRPDR